MIYKYVSSREVIDKFFGDTGYNEDIPFADVIRWISEALDMIAVKMQYVRKIAGDKNCPYLIIENYKAKLPCDFFRLEQLAINGLPAIAAKTTMLHTLGQECCSVDDLMKEITQVYKDNFGNIFTVDYPGSFNLSNTTTIEYDINNNFITTNVKDGFVCMAYLAYPIDEEGFPLIPDDVYYLRAVAAFITRMLDYRKWRTYPSKDSKELFDHSEREWLWYIGAAKGSGNQGDLSTMESWKTSIVSLIPNLPKHNKFYKF